MDEHDQVGAGGRTTWSADLLGDDDVDEQPRESDLLDGSLRPGASIDGGLVDARTGDGGPDASALTIEDVRALGTGCPRGTASVRIADDGRGFTLALSADPVRLEETSAFAPTSCGLSIFVQAPPGVAYAIERYVATGYASLEEGQSLRVTSSYAFDVATPASASKVTRLEGPYDARFSIEERFAEHERAFSPCGGGRFVNLELHLNLRNGTPRRAGSYRLEELGAVRFVTRPCNHSSIDASTPP